MKQNKKIDFKKELQQYYRPGRKDFELVIVPALHFLMIDGHGDPNEAAAYTEAVEALYSLSYRLKFISKKELERDYVVPPLEGLWWADDMASYTTLRDKSAWDWTMMILVPDWLDAGTVERARQEVAQKKDLPALPAVRHELYDEGLSAQILHIGSYDAEGPVLARLHQFWIPEHGLAEAGKHHEIYLSDPRRVAPDKLKTVLRQPVRKI